MVRRRTLQMGAAAIALAVAVRLTAGGVLTPLTQTLGKWETASLLLYLETGRVVRPPNPPEPTTPQLQTPAQSAESLERPAFSGEETVSIRESWDYGADVPALLEQPLRWDLRQEVPTVLIYHTHASESYTKEPGQDYAEEVPYRTQDTDYNMVAVGAAIQRRLEAAGIHTLHDTTLHDYPSYNGSYDHARQTLEGYFSQYPSLLLVLDVHRDAAEDGNGNQVATTATLSTGETAAQLMFVLGSEGGGYEHPYWEDNLALAVKLQALLEEKDPGICRSLQLTAQRYNQEMYPGMLLVEVGTAGNTLTQALRSAERLSDAIIALADGTA